MLENRVETLAAIYPMESRRALKNYLWFLEDYPDWHEEGRSFYDYKRGSFAGGLSIERTAHGRPEEGGK